MRVDSVRTTALLLLSLSTRVLARDKILYTSSITYCAPPDVLTVDDFDVKYFDKNSSISFSLSATNLASDLNATANIMLNAYGMTPANYTFDICSVLEGELCPLPQYNFSGSAFVPLPASLQLPIPAIAFAIPDLEAVAQLKLIRVETNEVAVCIQSTLANGRSLHTPAVSIATATIALVSLIISVFYSFRHPPSSPKVFRIVDNIQYFQHIAMSGMLHLNYPLVYTAFSTNFAWSFGIFDLPNIQNAIERMRYLTGSRLAQDPQKPASYSNRGLSPYNLVTRDQIPDDSLSVNQTATTNIVKIGFAMNAGIPNVNISGIVGGDPTQPSSPQHSYVSPATIVSNEDTLAPGIPVYVNYKDVATGNAFMTTFFTLLFIILAVVALSAILFLVCKVLVNKRQSKRAENVLAQYRPTIISNGLRILLVTFLPVWIMIFFQWTLHDNWLCTLFSVLTFLFYLSALAYPTFLVIKTVRLHGPRELEEPDEQGKLGALTAPYLTRRYYLFIISIVANFLRACFVSFAHANGFIQVIGLVIVELFYFFTLVFLRPSHKRRGDVFTIFMAVLRTIATAALLPFVKEKLSVEAIPRVGIGIGIAIVQCVGVLVVLGNIVSNVLPWKRILCGWRKGNGRRQKRNQHRDSSGASSSSLDPKKEDQRDLDHERDQQGRLERNDTPDTPETGTLLEKEKAADTGTANVQEAANYSGFFVTESGSGRNGGNVAAAAKHASLTDATAS